MEVVKGYFKRTHVCRVLHAVAVPGASTTMNLTASVGWFRPFL